MSEKTWIQEQKEIQGLFTPSGGGDADRMLEISETNRYLNSQQGKLLIAGRIVAKLMNLQCLSDLCDLTEAAQLCTDGRSRSDFMRVAIEQWQGKLANAKSKAIEILS